MRVAALRSAVASLPPFGLANAYVAGFGIADLPRYLRLTNEAIASINWYRRFVQGVLKLEAGDARAD